MSTQLVVRVPEALIEALDHRAKRLARKRSEIIRIALQQYVARPEPLGGDRVAEEMEKYFGILDSGIPDLATNHRKYLLEILRRKQRQGRL